MTDPEATTLETLIAPPKKSESTTDVRTIESESERFLAIESQ